MIEPSPVSSSTITSSSSSSFSSLPSASSSSSVFSSTFTSSSSSTSSLESLPSTAPLSGTDEVQVLKELTISLKDVKASASTTLKKLKSCTLREMNLFKELVTLRDDVHIPELHGTVSVSESKFKSNFMSVTLKNDVIVNTERNIENIENDVQNVENIVEVKTVKKRKSKKVSLIEEKLAIEVELQVEVTENTMNKIELEDTVDLISCIEKEMSIEAEEKVENVFLFPKIAFENSKNSLQIKSEIDFNIPVVDSSYFIYTGEKADAESILEGMSLSFLTPLKLLRRQYHKIHRKIDYE